MDSIDDVLNGEVTTETISDSTKSTEKAETADNATDDTKPTGDEVKTDSTETAKTEDAPPASHTEGTVPRAALEDERKKRQASDKELNELKAKQNKDTEEAERDPNLVFNNPTQFRADLQSDFDKQLLNNTLNQSEFFVAKEIGEEKLAEKIETFKTICAENPVLKQRFAQAVSPYHELVKIVDQHNEFDKMSDIDAYKAKLKEEAKAEVLAEQKTKSDEKEKLRNSIPNSLVDETSAGDKLRAPSQHTPTWNEMLTLSVD